MKTLSGNSASSGVGYYALVVQLLSLWIAQGRPPDVLSREWTGENEPLIRFEWFTGRVREFPCSSSAYDQAWGMYQSYWRQRAE